MKHRNEMSNEWIIKDAHFLKVKHLYYGLKNEVLIDFITTLFADNIYRFRLHDISNLYMLVGFKGSEHYLRPGEKSFAELLSKEDYATFQKHDQMILGYMMVSKSKKRQDIHFIDYIDTMVPKLNLANVMLEKYQERKPDVQLIPREFIHSSIDYWYLKQGYDLFCEEKYKQALNEAFYLDDIQDEIKWGVLYERIEKDLASQDDS